MKNREDGYWKFSAYITLPDGTRKYPENGKKAFRFWVSTSSNRKPSSQSK